MNFTRYNTSADTSIKYDVGLRSYMLQIFNLMSVALIVTGVMAFYASSETFMSLIISKTAHGVGLSLFGWVIQLAPLFIVLFLSYKIQSMSVQAAKLTFWIYSVVMCLSLGLLSEQNTGESLARAFFVTAAAFGSMSIYGYTTKKDLTSFGSFLFMGLMGIVIASLVNMFMQSSAIAFAVSVIGVLVFTGLTAYDVQKIKHMYVYSNRMDQDSAAKMAIYGALTLYLDFINLFIMMLRLLGNRRD